MGQRSEVQEITPDFLKKWQLPQPQAGGDKNERGRVLVVGGAPEMPGAIILAAVAALRVGAGKLQIATCESIAPHVATAVPESRTIALPQTGKGGIASGGASQLVELAERADAVLFGPGMTDEPAVSRLLKKVLPELQNPVVLLDAAAFEVLRDEPKILAHLKGRTILTPHFGEMANMLDAEKNELEQKPVETARNAAAHFGAVVALKSDETYIAAPDGKIYLNRYGCIGLATSGSGDTLSGLVAGLAARGADPAQATAWGVYLHARAGDVLTEKVGSLGFLARELLAEIPPIMHKLT
jgi:ADP-dependent NAD(P)H-hydrate dehydratase